MDAFDISRLGLLLKIEAWIKIHFEKENFKARRQDDKKLNNSHFYYLYRTMNHLITQ